MNVLEKLAAVLRGGVRYALTFAALCALWWFSATTMNAGFDFNLGIIKLSTVWVDSSGKTEAALRAFAAEKMLLFTEISVLVHIALSLVLSPVKAIWRRAGGN